MHPLRRGREQAEAMHRDMVERMEALAALGKIDETNENKQEKQ
jgi:hypothetical protein